MVQECLDAGRGDLYEVRKVIFISQEHSWIATVTT
jgi:hypothetical protein